MVLHAGLPFTMFRAGLEFDGSKPSALRTVMMPVDVVPIDSFATVFTGQPNDVVAKPRI
jgi:hypothetical protein